jgi:membrane fusion protein, multidrug efflux system
MFIAFAYVHFNVIEMFKIWIILGMFSLLFSCSGPADKSEDVPANVSLYLVTARDTMIESEYVADIHACKYIEIRSRQAGMLEEILVEEGQNVKSGQPLFRLSTTELNLKVNAAKANVSLQEAELQKAKVEAGRVKLLVEKQVVSVSDMELALAEVKIAESRLESAKSELTSAETHLGYATIRAPFSGLINRFHLKAGSRVEEGSLLTTLSDISSVYVYFNISEKAYLKYQNTENGQGMPQEVKLRLADQSLFQGAGKIETTESEFNENTGSIAVRARFDNPNRILRHASGGTVLLPRKMSNALMIPQTSVLELQDKYYVFMPDGNNIVKMRSIIPEVRVGNAYVVREGLRQGEKIIISGVQELRDGQKVQPLFSGEKSISNP